MAQPRNVVLLVADSLRWDTVHTGEPGLPYLGRRGLRFDQARSGGCWTLPATASMFTGLSPHEHGADAQTRSINQAPTLAERMNQLGLSTHMVTANVATTDIFGLDRGFDTLDRVWKLVDARAHRRIHEALVLAGKPRLRKKVLSKDFVMGKMSEDLEASKVWLQSTADTVFDRTRQLLAENARKNQRGFFFLNLMESHFPYHISDAFECSADTLLGQLRELYSLYHLVNQTWLTTDRQHIAPDMLELLRRRQRLAWERLAPRIDAFVKELREEHDATVVFCADHGDNFGEQGWLYHFSNVTDAGNRVPLYILPNDRDLARVSEAPVSARDVFGTLLRAAGDADPTLISLLDTSSDRSLPVLESFWYNNNGKTLPQFRYNQFAFVAGGMRYSNRGGRWFQAPATRGLGAEAPFIALDRGIDPLQERVDTADRLMRLRRSWHDFSAFSDELLTRKHTRAAA
jgi:hypothetical protein